ncbi:C2H2 finger domain transcription factor mtfA [Colletotrichum spaethianum]|uniref:C2H2 finger domain transcription factor mtfA n=1 Tax=Colletotrichum spaethianum TaxID=700344 RepID=A0AA37L8H9_9PEZI|nr:C2H2 finger domain transcription factor mtfA [Colletotrichum spaethianum]GKT42624.1 C2H2 finger domain transcription factor mtfA [Colletotrichum spaethianum]
MASALISNPYAAQQSTHYGYVQPPQPPPSPPMDETSKCSLPSISNLLGLADQGSPTSETHPQIPQQGTDWTDYHQHSNSYTTGRRLTLETASSQKSETRPNSSHYGRGGLPPTPPMSSDASFDGYNSPSTRSVSHLSVVSQPQSNYYYESTPPLEADAHRHMAPMVSRVPVPASYAQQPFPPAYMPAHNPMAASYYPPMQPTPPPQAQISGIYYQRPLPQQFPPMAPVPVGLGPAGSNPWQHHHYISPSSAASFPQSQDRYICQTCNKAFSRPSSLRIHSHSHTGEKPFKCPHAGCGKAFSVRSNMKRHERGCHSFESGSN